MKLPKFELPKFDKAKVKEVASMVAVAALFFAIPVTYQIAKERSLVKALVANGCQPLGEPIEGAFPIAPFIKEGYLCLSVVDGTDEMTPQSTIVPIYK